MKRTIQLGLLALAAVSNGMALAKLPAPSDEAKAKAAEAAAKAAHGGKMAAFQLCKSQERVAVAYRDASKKAGKDVKPPVDTPACADPGPFGAASAPAAPAMAAVKPAMAAKK